MAVIRVYLNWVKQVDIAGHFNGIIGIDEPENITLDDEGKPSSMRESYQELLSLGNHYPQGQVEILNIYGNTGKGSDERVTNLSSQSLGYLLKSSSQILPRKGNHRP